MQIGLRAWGIPLALGLAGLVPTPGHAADGDPVLIELHYKPVPNAQIAIWLEDTNGNFVQDVLVTQATGTLGIGNRPGHWDFLSSWRFPYGPRTGVLPIWAHKRGKSYPALVFHDADPGDEDSIGWHENTSSTEPYFCRPLAPEEHAVISTDTMTCPSPSGFRSDKGRFSDGTSVYPPRGDLTSFDASKDHVDATSFAELNDLDAVTGATAVGNAAELLTFMVPGELTGEPLVAWIEVNLEDDQNADWSFDRDADHFVDQRLPSYGVGYLGQPSVVYRVEFDPAERGFSSTDRYVGYGDLDGQTGTIHPPDATISERDGSGADRLLIDRKNDVDYRFAVYSHGNDGVPPPPDEPDWGGCTQRSLPTMTELELEAVAFDRVRVHFTVPTFDDAAALKGVRLFYRTAAEDPLGDGNASTAIQQVPTARECGGAIRPGVRTWCDLDELFGSTEYQVGIRYEDTCSNVSRVVSGSVTTPQQEFATVDGFCFVATAAYGAPWAGRVRALRWFRDAYLRSTAFGQVLVEFYYYASPGLADLLASSPLAREMTRTILEPLTDVAGVVTSRQGSR